jgi:hypothetical protein
MIVPSPNYSARVPLFEEVFASGVAPYLQATGVDLHRLVTGRELVEIRPYLATDRWCRFTHSGAFTLFAADKEAALSPEVLQSTGYSNAPSPSIVVSFGFTGDVFPIERTQHSGFVQGFLDMSGTAKHEFSCDCRYFLESRQMLTGTQAVVWGSPAAAAFGVSAQTFAVLAPFSGALTFKSYEERA